MGKANMVKPVVLLAVGMSIACISASAITAENACADPEDRQFDFWIGEWDIVNRQRNPGNPADASFYPTGPAVGRAYPVAGGCAIAEQWRGELSWGLVQGFSLRTYDAQSGKWILLLNWPAPNAPTPSPFSIRDGEFRHGRGEFFSSTTSTDGTTTLSRFTFSDINDDRFRWDSAASTDGGVSWRTSWIMEVTRRLQADGKAASPGPMPAAEYSACTNDEGSQSLTYLDGKWTGQAVSGDEVFLKIMPIMGGCAVMEFLRIGKNNALQEFRVRAYQPDKSQWVQFVVNNKVEGLAEFAGNLHYSRLEWAPPDADASVESWVLDDKQILHLNGSRFPGEAFSAKLFKAL